MKDTDLIRGTAAGNDRLYAELMRRYLRSVFHFVCGYVSIEVAEEITRDTFYTFWKHAGTYKKDERKFRRRLFSIAYNLSMRHLYKEHVLEQSTSPLSQEMVADIPTKKFVSIRPQRISLINLADSLRKPINNFFDWRDRVRKELDPVIMTFLARVMDRRPRLTAYNQTL